MPIVRARIFFECPREKVRVFGRCGTELDQRKLYGSMSTAQPDVAFRAWALGSSQGRR